jgi:hypothetical protein
MSYILFMLIHHGKSEITNYDHVVINISNIPNISNISNIPNIPNISIHITPIYNSRNSLRSNIQLQTTEIVDNSFTVYSNGANIKFFWMVCYE